MDWDGSHRSDHTLICTFACTPYHVKTPKGDRTNGFNTEIDVDQWAEWHRIMRDASPIVYGPIQNTEEVDTIIDLIYAAFNTACSTVMKRKGTSSARSAPWWSTKLGELSKAVQQAQDDKTRQEADCTLKKAVHKAKHMWADSKITSSNVWEVAAWRHGRRMTIIPALKGEEDELVYNHKDMANILSKRFFAKDTGQVPLDLPDDPEPREVWEHVPITEQETLKMLMEMSNSSAPGFSGIGYQLLKQACLGWDKVWEGLSATLISIYNACLSLGHHPAIWKQATFMVIPKADQPDYTHAKTHHSISLLETMSKLLEKIIAKHMQHKIMAHELIPTNQFGRCMHSSCLDMGLTLLHAIQCMQQVSLKCGILLFDIKGFFNNITHDCMVNILRKLGYSHEVVNWTNSFLSQ